jgi:prepilin peptidase CpaA
MEAVGNFSFYLAVAAFAGLASWAAYTDYTRYIIPNRICVAIAALYPCYVIAAPQPVDWTGGLLTGLAMLGVGFVMFMRRWSGAGDVKILTVVGVWAGPNLVLPFLLMTAVAGGLVSVITAARLYFATPNGGGEKPSIRQVSGANVPYGIAVAVGALFVASQLLSGRS